MEMNPGALPRPWRVPTHEFWSPKLVGDGGGDRNCFWRKGVWNQGFRDGRINRGAKGEPRGPQGSQEGRWRDLGWGRARHPPGPLVVALLPCLGYSRSSRSADFLYNFSGIYWALLMAGKPEIQKQQKTGTGNWVH